MPLSLTEILSIGFYLVAGIQIIYWLYFLVGMLRVKSFKPADEDFGGISVIVAAQNEIHNLRALIPKLLEQRYSELEIIIVNDRSDDGTIEYLLDIEKENQKFKALHIHDRPEHINGKKYALTLGVKAAKYENILLTDADCMPTSSNWVAAMGSGLQYSKFVLGFSSYNRLKGFLNYFIRFETVLTGVQYLASAVNGGPYMGVGRNMGYKKSFFLDKKGFLGFQDLMGGDDDLFVNKYAKSGSTAVVTGKDALVLSTPKQTWKAFLRQKHRHLSVGKYYRPGTKLKIGLFNMSWILYLVLLVSILLFTFDPIIIGTLAGSRLVVLLVTILVGTKRFGITFEWLGVLLLDLIYPIYYIFVGTKAIFVKSISWE